MFLLHMRVPLYLGHRCSVLRFPLDGFFLWLILKCPSLSLFIDFSLKSILLDIRIATQACFLGSFDWNFFPNTLLWGNVCLWGWGVFLACSRRMDSVFVSNLLACLFIGELSSFILRDINDQWLLSPVNLIFIAGDINFSPSLRFTDRDHQFSVFLLM